MSAQSITGRVVSGSSPVPFVNMAVIGSSTGTVSDTDGKFSLMVEPGRVKLAFSAIGFESKEVEITVISDLDLGDISLQKNVQELDPMIVTATMRPMSRSESPLPIQVLSSTAFRSDPTPSLVGAIAQVNGVSPQLNCSVCNTSDIHINGMEGPYTMVLIDGMPIVSGLSTVYGLSGIPTSLIERIEIVKGPGSSLYGSEAMGGVLNIITKSPALADRVSSEVTASSWGEIHADVGLASRKDKFSNLFGLNSFYFQNPIDKTGDGFTDLTLQKRISLFNKVVLNRPGGKEASVAIRGIAEERWGGEMNWNKRYQGSNEIYGESISTNRVEAIAQYRLPIRERVMAQLSFNSHHQRSFYGTTEYNAVQQVGFGQIYTDFEAGALHNLLCGISFRHRSYNDNTTATSSGASDRAVKTNVPGLFIQDEYRFSRRSTVLTGYRVDHEKVHGLVHSPRIAYKFKPNGKWAVRGSFATGFRVVDVFTEDHAALTGSREVQLTENLLPERSVNGTVNIIRRFRSEKRFIELDLTIFHSYFSNRIIADLDTDPQLILYSNLDGSAVSQGVSFDQVLRLGNELQIRNGVSYMEVYSAESDAETGISTRSQQLFAPRWSGTVNVDRTFNNRLELNLSAQWYGPMRLPVQPKDPRPEYSPLFAHVNMQVRKAFNTNFEVFAGIKNILDFVPADPILRPEDPFNEGLEDPSNNPDGLSFDTTYIYASLQGRRCFLGLRMQLN